jgi:hypothetical protein
MGCISYSLTYPYALTGIGPLWDTLFMSKRRRKTRGQPQVVRGWTDEERRAHTEQRLRATTIPNKRRIAARTACRNKAQWA